MYIRYYTQLMVELRMDGMNKLTGSLDWWNWYCFKSRLGLLRVLRTDRRAYAVSPSIVSLGCSLHRRRMSGPETDLAAGSSQRICARL
jgi:hypothetical protein